ncbi:MAG: hypothetical protein ACI8WB_003584 [Phenylobacterium sp.]
MGFALGSFNQQTMELNMRYTLKMIMLLISLSWISGCATANKGVINKNVIKSEVRQAFNGLIEASKALDSNRYFQFFDHDKFSGLNADGTVWHSIKDLQALILPGFAMIEKSVSLEFNNVKVTVINQTTAILVNEYKQTLQLKSGDIIKQSGGGTQVWSKSQGVWKLVSVSASAASH